MANFLQISTPQQWFSASRLQACKTIMPYLAPAIMDLTPFEQPGLGTWGVTDRGVLLWDPATFKEWEITEAAWVHCHEALHYIRGHGARRKDGGFDHPPLWNICTDCEINDDLEEAGCIWLGPKAKVRRGDPTPTVISEQTGIKLENGNTAEGYYHQLRHLAKTVKVVIRGKDKGCGSGSGGDPLPGEENVPGEMGRSAAHKERVKKEVAEGIRTHVRQNGIGSVPSGLQVWAEDVLGPPRVRWQDKLARLCRNAIAFRPGQGDYTYRRPSRRQGAFGYADGQPVLQGLHTPVPRVAVAVDTSGSMGKEQLTDAMREARGVLMAVGARVDFIACDAAVHEGRPVRHWQEMTRLLKGGGGTDFRPVFEHVARLKPKPELLVFLTDGYGPAPETAPVGLKTIWFLVGGNTRAPATWGETVTYGVDAPLLLES